MAANLPKKKTGDVLIWFQVKNGLMVGKFWMKKTLHLAKKFTNGWTF